MDISWVISGEVAEVNGVPYSPLASIRLRCLIPAGMLEAKGHRVNIITSETLSDPGDLGDTDFGAVVVFAKSFNPVNEVLAARAKALGRAVICDFCDFDFDSPEFGAHRMALQAYADGLVAGSDFLADAVAERLGVPRPTVVSDPFEGPAGAPLFAPGKDRLRLAWFGHQHHLPGVFAEIDGLAELGRQTPISLEVVTAPVEGTPEAFAAANRHFDGRLTLAFTPWSLDAARAALSKCDLVIIPSLLDKKNNAKSPNRLVETLRAGRFAVACPVPSYRAFAEFACLEGDIAAGIAWAVANAGDVPARIEAGQHYIARHHAPEAIAAAWAAVFERIA